MAKRKKKHCWHSTGQGLSYGYSGGTTQHRCCHCGALVSVSWSEKHSTIKGHGPYVMSRETTYDWTGIATHCDPLRLPGGEIVITGNTLTAARSGSEGGRDG